MLKELNKLWTLACRQAATWRRWQRKLPHNRVHRRRIRDEKGHVIGYGPPEPLPEPRLSSPFCRMVSLPSGRVDVLVGDCAVALAYRQARRPRTSAADVQPLPMSEGAIRKVFGEYCR